MTHDTRAAAPPASSPTPLALDGATIGRAIAGDRSERVVAYFPGGGITGALYQLGVLTALEAAFPELRAHRMCGYVGVGSGAVLGASFASGLEAQRLYRGLLDPADPLFAIERRHIFRVDVEEWRWTLGAAFSAAQRIVGSITRKPVETAIDPWAELDRFHDVLPAGIFSLEHLERFLDAFFVRRGVPATFRELSRPLLVPAHDLDTGATTLFGTGAHGGDRIARATTASMALAPFFNPVRIGDRMYVSGNTGNAVALEAAITTLQARTVLVINPMVPVRLGTGTRIQTGHGDGRGVADKGMLWVYNQAMRIADHANLSAELALLRLRRPDIEVLLIEPTPSDALLFMDSPMSYAARRTILEDAYRSTRERLRGPNVSAAPPPAV